MRKLQLEELGRVDVAEYKGQEKRSVVVILDNIRSAMNVGSIFRTSDAFAIEKIIISGISATPPHKEITKTAIGATEAVEWEYVEDCVPWIKEHRDENTSVIAIEQTDSSIALQDYEIIGSRKYFIIMGNEVDGVRDEVLAVCDDAIEIPQHGTKHSLNVAVCTGVVLWQFTNEKNIKA